MFVYLLFMRNFLLKLFIFVLLISTFNLLPAVKVFADLEQVSDFSSSDPSKPSMNSLTLGLDGMLYGVTNSGGKYGKGNLFQYNPTTNIITSKVDFNDNVDFNDSIKKS